MVPPIIIHCSWCGPSCSCGAAFCNRGITLQWIDWSVGPKLRSWTPRFLAPHVRRLIGAAGTGSQADLIFPVHKSVLSLGTALLIIGLAFVNPLPAIGPGQTALTQEPPAPSLSHKLWRLAHSLEEVLIHVFFLFVFSWWSVKSDKAEKKLNQI